MTIIELYDQIISRFHELEGVSDLLNEKVSVSVSAEPEKTLRPENDPPSTVARPEYCVTAVLSGPKEGRGEAYTETPVPFEGTLKEALAIPPTEEGISAVTISAINAAMNALGLTPGEFPEEAQFQASYADALCRFAMEKYGKEHLVLVGYDGYIVKRLMDEGLVFWTLDMNPDHIAQDRFDHVIVNGAKRNRESSFAWGNLFIVTGSSLCNGTIVHYLNSGKELLFYGITCAGAATLLDLPWFSPANITK